MMYESSIINLLDWSDSSDNRETELSASVALPAESDEEANKKESKDKTDELPKVIAE